MTSPTVVQQPPRNCEFDRTTLEITRNLPDGLDLSDATLLVADFVVTTRHHIVSKKRIKKVACVNRVTGAVNWEIGVGFIVAQMVGNESVVALASAHGEVLVADFRTGSTLWEAHLSDSVSGNVADLTSLFGRSSLRNLHIWNDQLIVSLSHKWISIDINNGRRLREVPTLALITHTVVDWRDRLYFFSNRMKENGGGRATYDDQLTLSIFNVSSGEAVLHRAIRLGVDIKESSVNFATVTDTHYLGLMNDGHLFAVDLASGDVGWIYKVDGVAPAGVSAIKVRKNRVYVQTRLGVTSQISIFEGEGGIIDSAG